MESKDCIGKYVCYDRDDRFCWGRIVGEAKSNTVNGIKDSFIVDSRLVGQKDGFLRKIPGKSIIRQESIDLFRDVVDIDFLVGMMDERGLYEILLSSQNPKNATQAGFQEYSADFMAAVRRRLDVNV